MKATFGELSSLTDNNEIENEVDLSIFAVDGTRGLTMVTGKINLG